MVRRNWLVWIMAFCAMGEVSPGQTTTRNAGDLNRDDVLKVMETLEPQSQVFSCEATVIAVNGLRRLGKEEALKVLRQYYSVPTNVAGMHEWREMNVLCLCRLVFVPPKGGWEVPWADFKYMTDSGQYDVAAKQGFPLYPIALSNNVPFLLNMGWRRPNGRGNIPIPDEGKKHLDLSDTLEVISGDLAVSGFDEAAKKLLESDEFKRLSAGTLMREEIPQQATRGFRKGDPRRSN